MSKVIKGGTVVTADLTYKADVKIDGDVIVEIAQDFMEAPQDVADKIQELKKDDRRNAYLMIANQKGELRLVAVPIE